MKLVNSMPILFILLVLSCKGQNDKISSKIKQAKMTTEKFDIEKFNKDRMVYESNEGYDGQIKTKLVKLNDIIDTLPQGIRRRIVDKEEYAEYIIPKEGLFCEYKSFYLNGTLKTKYTKQEFLGTVSYIPSGKEYYYNKEGKLIKEVDNDKLYNGLKISPNVLFDILDNKGIYDKIKRPEGVLFVWFHCEDTTVEKPPFLKMRFNPKENPFWEVTRDFLDPKTGHYQKTYKIDAVQGDLKEIMTIKNQYDE